MLFQRSMIFLDCEDVPVSNNLTEKAFRPFLVGRKNWLFCDSVKGAESSAIVYSLAETAKANDIEPYEYLMLVLSMLRTWVIPRPMKNWKSLCPGTRQ